MTPQNTVNDRPAVADEIDLIELFRALWASKALIVMSAVIVTAVAAAYAFLSPPVYQTTAQILPPTASDLANYNIASQLTGHAIGGTVTNTAIGISALTPEDAYAVFLRYLGSSAVRQRFFDEYYLPAQENKATKDNPQRAWMRLDKELTIKLPSSQNEVQSSIILEGKDPQTIAKWANAYADLASQAASKNLKSKLQAELEIRRRSLNDQIATARQIAQKVRQNQITRLKAALAIAESIGLETIADSAPLIAINTQDPSADSINSGSVLYLRGARALRSELQQLEQRQNEDAYISELPDLLKKQALIGEITLDSALLNTATIDHAAIVPVDPIKPRKALILLLGLVLGGMLGVFIALVRRQFIAAP
ncbi:Wzz/FepE/Etk N-terminal domain-containing protein [Castellaniella sp. FW104-16D08]|uniref:Wzz/FepE/Etk N-terminal domain-containing protein n=1 Tax=unclassified Castellaniella TaxID=2617606 RepID=UPI003316034F